jgi:hypothetical protein
VSHRLLFGRWFQEVILRNIPGEPLNVNVSTLVGNAPIARGAAIVGSLLMIGARGSTAAPATVADGQAVDLLADTYGRLVVRPWSVPELCWSYAVPTGGIVTTTDTPIAAAAGAGLRRYLNSLTLSNNNATATEFVVKDGAATVLARFALPANAPNTSVRFEPPLAGSANTAMNVACLTTAAAVFCNAQGFTAP